MNFWIKIFGEASQNAKLRPNIMNLQDIEHMTNSDSSVWGCYAI